MEEMKKEQIPQIGSRLRQHILKIPEAVFQASGIIINGRRIKSFVFTTDLAIIRNCDADAVFAVYPFTPQQAISDAIIRSSYIPGVLRRWWRDDQGNKDGIPGEGRGVARCYGSCAECTDFRSESSGCKQRRRYSGDYHGDA